MRSEGLLRKSVMTEQCVFSPNKKKILLLSVFTPGKKWGQSVGPVNITGKKKRKERKIKACYFIWL